MLPYTPLHHLLLGEVGRPIVLTSGNVSDEPIAYTDADALARLAGIADAFLTHERAIHTGPTTRWCGRCGAGKRCCAAPAVTRPNRSASPPASHGPCWPAARS
jgi:hypothetical protein